MRRARLNRLVTDTAGVLGARETGPVDVPRPRPAQAVVPRRVKAVHARAIDRHGRALVGHHAVVGTVERSVVEAEVSRLAEQKRVVVERVLRARLERAAYTLQLTPAAGQGM